MLATHFTLENFKQLVKTKNLQIVQDYERGIVAKCSAKNVNQQLVTSSEESFGNPANLPKYFQCLATCMGMAWKANGAGERWSKYQPQLQIHLDNWKTCGQLENPDDRDSCVFFICILMVYFIAM